MSGERRQESRMRDRGGGFLSVDLISGRKIGRKPGGDEPWRGRGAEQVGWQQLPRRGADGARRSGHGRRAWTPFEASGTLLARQRFLCLSDSWLSVFELRKVLDRLRSDQNQQPNHQNQQLNHQNQQLNHQNQQPSHRNHDSSCTRAHGRMEAGRQEGRMKGS